MELVDGEEVLEPPAISEAKTSGVKRTAETLSYNLVVVG
jgi:hypothetical protein